nr:alpha/beta hydrolase [Caulobacter hibisci]
MIHGYGMTGDGWTPAAEAFRKAGYAVETPTIQPKLRTVSSPKAELGGLSLGDYVAELSALAAVTAARDGIKPIVFGHSMGGLIAQKLAESGLTSGIVLFAPASPADARGKPKLSPLFTFLNAALTQGGPPKPVKMWKTGFKFGVVNAVPSARHDALYATAVYDSGRVLQDLAYPDRDPSRTAHVDAAKVTVPVLVLAGARDRTTPVEDLRLVGRKYAGADYREYPDHAHWLIDEPGSAALYDAAKAWLAEKGLGPASAPPPSKAKTEPKAEPVAAATPAPEPKVETPTPAPTAKAPAKTKTPSKAKTVVAEPAVKPAAKAPAKPKAAAAPKPAAPKPVAKAEVAPAPAKTEAKPKAAPAKTAKPKTPAPVEPAPAAKATPKAKVAPKPQAKPKPEAKAEPVAKVAKPKAAPPAAEPATPAPPKPVAKAKPAPAAKAEPALAPTKAAPKAKSAPTAKAAPKAAPAPKPAAKSKATPKAAATKAAATTTPAKTSPRGKKSV